MNDVETTKNAMVDEKALCVRNLSKVYPGTVALERVNLEVKKGEVHGIIGKNGAGKSTLVGIIAGVETPTEGEIEIGGKKFTALSRINSKKEKIAIVPQEPQVILDLTVAESLFIPDYRCRGNFIDWKKLYDEAKVILERAGLNIDPKAKMGDLSISEQQLVLVTKAFYVEESKIIILDEVSASLSQNDEELLYKIIEERKREGNTILFISHRVDELLRICDRVTVLRDGRSISTNICRNLDEEKLSSLIIGENNSFNEIKRNRSFVKKANSDKIIMSVRNLTRYGVFYDINFDVRKGEILGIAGLRGSGRTEILKSIAGIEPVDEGYIIIKGKNRRFFSPSQAFKEGIVYLPEDREREGLINVLSVRENLILNSLHKLKKYFFINKFEEKKKVKELISVFDIKASSSEQEVSQLSGGNKQKVIVGRIASVEPEVLLLDEPTRGIDIAAKESILKIIRDYLSQFSGIVITSPGLDDLILVCDRILILYKGKIVGEYSKEEFLEETLYIAIQGVNKNKEAEI